MTKFIGDGGAVVDGTTLIVMVALLALLLLEYLWLEVRERRKKHKTKGLVISIASDNKFLQKNGENNHS
jgi:hypothetical protein